MNDIVLSIAIIAAALLAWFGVRTAMAQETRTKGFLMIIMSVVLIANVLIWTVPT